MSTIGTCTYLVVCLLVFLIIIIVFSAVLIMSRVETDEILEKRALTEVKLKTLISEEEYEKGKKVFMENSGDHHRNDYNTFTCLSLSANHSSQRFPTLLLQAINKLHFLTP